MNKTKDHETFRELPLGAKGTVFRLWQYEHLHYCRPNKNQHDWSILENA